MSRSFLPFFALVLVVPVAVARTPNDLEQVPNQDTNQVPNPDTNQDTDQGGPLEATVPSASYPTIQDAVDAVASGGTVRLAPGVYRESLVVTDKYVTLVGEDASSTRIKGSGANGDEPVIDLVGAAGVSLATLTVSHGGYGVRAVVADGVSPSAALVTQGAEIELVGRGVYGSFADVEMTDSVVRNTGWNGLSLLRVDRLVLDGLTVRGADGVGLLVLNDVAADGGLRLVSASTFEQNKGGGLEVHGSALPMRVLNSDFDGNRVAGVTLVDVDGAYLYGLAIDRTAAVPDTGAWGDGVRVFGSVGVELKAIDVWSSARAGLSAFGCEDDPTSATVAGTTMDANGFDVEVGATAGCAGYMDVAFVVDEPSVTCDGDRCAAQSTSLAPSPPVAAP